MIGGCRKKMYYIKDTRSRLYSEAYFILREGADMDYVCENDLAAEADRILREKLRGNKRRIKLPKHFAALTFILGTLTGATLMWTII